jgi:hypothetical protein
MEEAVVIIDDLKTKFRSQGQQIITYRRKLRQQVRKNYYLFDNKKFNLTILLSRQIPGKKSFKKVVFFCF